MPGSIHVAALIRLDFRACPSCDTTLRPRYVLQGVDVFPEGLARFARMDDALGEALRCACAGKHLLKAIHSQTAAATG